MHWQWHREEGMEEEESGNPFTFHWANTSKHILLECDRESGIISHTQLVILLIMMILSTLSSSWWYHLLSPRRHSSCSYFLKRGKIKNLSFALSQLLAATWTSVTIHTLLLLFSSGWGERRERRGSGLRITKQATWLGMHVCVCERFAGWLAFPIPFRRSERIQFNDALEVKAMKAVILQIHPACNLVLLFLLSLLADMRRIGIQNIRCPYNHFLFPYVSCMTVPEVSSHPCDFGMTSSDWDYVSLMEMSLKSSSFNLDLLTLRAVLPFVCHHLFSTFFDVILPVPLFDCLCL